MRFPFGIFGRKETRARTYSEQQLLGLLGSTVQSKAGAFITADLACQVSAVYACVNIIASTISTLPCNLYQQRSNGKEKAVNLNLYRLLHTLPNPETTAAEFWEMYLWNLLLTGYGAAWKKRDQNGVITELWNIPTGNMCIDRNSETKELYYDVILDETTNQRVRLYPEDIMITRGKRFSKRDEVLDPVSTAREAMGLSLALEEYSSRYFSNGASTSGIVEYPNAMKEEAFKRFKDSFNEKYAGLGNAFRVLFLESGAKFTKISNNPEESQAIEARRFQAIEIARYFNVPPHKIMDLERATFSNIEQQNIDFVQSCLNPVCVKLEQTITKDLLMGLERKRYFAKFGTNALLRGDIKTRGEFYHNAINDGWMTINEVRDLEDLNSAGPEADRHYHNGNFVPLGASAQKGGDNNDGQQQA